MSFLSKVVDRCKGWWPKGSLIDPADLATGWIGAGLLLPIELVLLKPASFTLLATTFAMFVALGWWVGLSVAIGNGLAARTSRSSLRALARTVGSLGVTGFVGVHLFDGAKASTMAGAALAPIWFPLLCWVALAAVAWSYERWVVTRRRSLALAAVLLAGAAATEWINRRVQPSGYPDIHTMLMVAACCAAGLGARLFDVTLHRPWPQRGPASVLRMQVASGITFVFLAIALFTGLQTTHSRWQVATYGMHMRLLVRVAHAVFDFDRDGYSNVLGGGDCHNLDSRINPGAKEIPHNGRDENCDGVDDDLAAKALARERSLAQNEGDAWRSSPQVKQQLGRLANMNLVLLSIDALRADVFDGSAQSRENYPNLWRLLSESQHFLRCFAPSAGTDLSMGGVLTGQVDPFATKAPTLAEALQKAGRRTYAVIPTEVLRYVGKPILTRGFDGYEDVVNDLYQVDVGSHSTSARTTSLGMKFLDAHQKDHANKPFFLWLHYFDVHEHDELQPSDKKVRAALGDEKTLTRRQKYLRLVKLVDAEVGVVLQELARRTWAGNTVVALVSDHGEGLGEDRRLPENHGRFLYNALTHVPMSIKLPGVVGNRIERPTSLLDLHPTLLELFSVASPSVDGASALAHVLQGAPATLKAHINPLPLNESEQFGVIVWPHKLLIRRRENLAELYDLSTDFAERSDLSSEEPERVKALLGTFGALPHVEVDRTQRGRIARDRAAAASTVHEAAAP